MSSQYYNHINKRDILQNIACIGDAVDKHLQRSDLVASAYGDAYSKLVRRENDLQRPRNSRAVSPNAPPPTVDCVNHMFAIINEAQSPRYSWWNLDPECCDGEFFYACSRDDSLKKVVTKQLDDGTTKEYTVTYGFVLRQFWCTVEFSEEKGYNIPTYHESATKIITNIPAETLIEVSPKYEGRWHQLICLARGDNFSACSTRFTKEMMLNLRSKEEYIIPMRYTYDSSMLDLLGQDYVNDATRNWWFEYNSKLFILRTDGGDAEHCQRIYMHDGTTCSLVYNHVDTSAGYTKEMFKNEPETRINRPGRKDFGWWGACTAANGDIILIIETYSRLFLNINVTTGDCVIEDMFLYHHLENGIITEDYPDFRTSDGTAKHAGTGYFGCLIDNANHFYLAAAPMYAYCYLYSSYSVNYYNESEYIPAVWMYNEDSKKIEIAKMGKEHPAQPYEMNRPYTIRTVDAQNIEHFTIHACEKTSSKEDNTYCKCTDLGDWVPIKISDLKTFNPYYDQTPILMPINYNSLPMYPDVDSFAYRYNNDGGVMKLPYVVSIYNIVDYVEQINLAIEKITSGCYRLGENIIRRERAAYINSQVVANFSHIACAGYNNHRNYNQTIPTHNYRNHMIEFELSEPKDKVRMCLGATASSDTTDVQNMYLCHLECVFMMEKVNGEQTRVDMKNIKFVAESIKDDGKRVLVRNDCVRTNMTRGEEFNFRVDDNGILWLELYTLNGEKFKKINAVLNGTTFDKHQYYDYYDLILPPEDGGVRFEVM